LEGPAMEDVGIFYVLLVHFTVLWYILWTLGRVRRNLVYFSRLGILYQEKSGNPAKQLFLVEAYPVIHPSVSSLLSFLCLQFSIPFGFN
jgi:hypothetical protein